MKQELNTLKNEQDESIGVTNEINIVVGPGALLKEAREARGLSEQQVADKLNFRLRLLQNIEIDVFDRSLPEAFNRGYLKSYAQLVHVSEAVVLSSYDQLAEAQSQCAGMQSFSKGTEKQAEHKLLMRITYLILVIFITATVVWWLQTPSEQPEPIDAENANLVSGTADIKITDNSDLASDAAINESGLENSTLTENSLVIEREDLDVNDELNTLTQSVTDTDVIDLKDDKLGNNVSTPEISETSESIESINVNSITDQKAPSLIANVIFTFSGDCWVNIYDATGERIAWGVKKSGYVMRISGQAPFSITLGKPELVAIDYNDVAVDITGFNAGNIAKFSLPMTP